MKKLWCGCIILVLFFSACGSHKKEPVAENIVYFNNTYCNVTLSGEVCPFMFNYAYCGEKPVMGGIVAIAEDGKELPVEIEEFEILNLENGYSIVRGDCQMDISTLETGSQINIVELQVKMNGEDEKISMKEAYHIEKKEKTSKSAPIYWENIPGMTFESSSFSKELSYIYATKQDVIITDFDFLDYIKVTGAQVLVNDVLLGNIHDVFPLDLKAGETLKIKAKGDFSEYENSDLVTEVILFYEYEGKKMECSAITKNYAIKNKDVGLELLKKNENKTEGEENK